MTPELKSEPVEYVAVPENPGITHKKRDLLSVFLDSSSDEEGEQAAAHFSNSIKQEPSTSGLNVVSRPNGFTFQPPTKPEYQDVDVDALTNVFSEMVVSRHAILLANQWEPVRYEKGAALERIEGCVANMLVSAYTSNETNTNKEDANLVEDQLEQLMDRMVGWKISEKTTPQIDDIGNMVAQNKPKYLHISRRISRTAQIDEHARISMNNNLRAFIDHLKKTHPHEQLLIARLDAKEREKPLTEAERNAKIKAFAERETRKYMLNAGEEVVDKSLVVFDYSLLDKAQEKEKAEELPEFSYQHQQVGEVRPFEDEPMHYVSQKTPPVVRQPLRSALKKGRSFEINF
uniref:Uncharacterized protein n=1 Tax=Ditylenchus dipsaci TaxID=166011 RepID=A0A915EM08_9BILA